MKDIDSIRNLLTIVGVLVSGIAAYYVTIHRLKDNFRDKIEEQNKQLNDIKVELANLKNKDELQQQIIDQLKKHVLDNLPAFYKALEQKNKDK